MGGAKVKVTVINCKALDVIGTQINLVASIARSRGLEIVLTRQKADSLGPEVISKIQKVEGGYCILKVVRTLRGLKQRDMAKLLGISVNTYQKKESLYNGSDFSLIEVHNICNEFNLAPDTLFFTCQNIKIA
jgi:DNA-binding XRE family transcriptional regulator